MEEIRGASQSGGSRYLRGQTAKKYDHLYLPPSSPKFLSSSGVAPNAMIVKLKITQNGGLLHSQKATHNGLEFQSKMKKVMQ
jgi:hypothetical protein